MVTGDGLGFCWLATGNVHVLTSWSRVTPMLWWVACVDVHGFHRLVTGDANVTGGWSALLLILLAVDDGVAYVIGGW